MEYDGEIPPGVDEAVFHRMEAVAHVLDAFPALFCWTVFVVRAWELQWTAGIPLNWLAYNCLIECLFRREVGQSYCLPQS
jgi:hypothetical protein